MTESPRKRYNSDPSISIATWFSCFLAVLVTLFVVFACGGCAYVDIDGIIDAIDTPEIEQPTEVVEQPTEVVEPEPEPPTQEILIDYGNFWTLKLDGHFKANSHNRFAQATGTRSGLDLFRWGGKFAMRLYDRRIIFTEAVLGSISTPAPPDHWAESIRQSGTADWWGVLEIRYDPSGKVYMFRNGTLIGEWSFYIDGNVPPTRKHIKLYGFEGTITQ